MSNQIKSIEQINIDFLEAKKQVEYFTDKMLQAKSEMKQHAKYKEGDIVISEQLYGEAKAKVLSIVVEELVFSNCLHISYTLLKIKKDGSDSKHKLYPFPISEHKLLKSN